MRDADVRTISKYVAGYSTTQKMDAEDAGEIMSGEDGVGLNAVFVPV